LKCGFFGQRENIDGFYAVQIGIVQKNLVDFGMGDLIIDCDIHMVILDRHIDAGFRNDEAVRHQAERQNHSGEKNDPFFHDDSP